MLSRRALGWTLALAGVGGLLLLFLLAAPIRDYERFTCHEDAALNHPDVWLAVRRPQMGEPWLSRDAATGTTTVRPGCGHGVSGFTVRVRGDLEGQPGPFLLKPVGDGTYETASLAPRLAATWGLLLAAATGVALLARFPRRHAWLPPIGVLAGLGLALAAQAKGDTSSSIGFVVGFLLVPLACLLLPGFAVGAWAVRRTPAAAVLLALSLVALGFLAQWFAFLEAFPTFPSA